MVGILKRKLDQIHCYSWYLQVRSNVQKNSRKC